MASTQTAITVAGLRKAYGSKQVLDGVDFAVPTGTVFALLGPTEQERPPSSISSPP
ncbi:hypothetical protein [Pseudarthrobacter sp. Y6]|uniref:hypothetical protein n=1 Tax=Pseudarthrobacter sp. Y6 TaxID=3418422 RepID=UPI003CF7A117